MTNLGIRSAAISLHKHGAPWGWIQFSSTFEFCVVLFLLIPLPTLFHYSTILTMGRLYLPSFSVISNICFAVVVLFLISYCWHRLSSRLCHVVQCSYSYFETTALIIYSRFTVNKFTLSLTNRCNFMSSKL